MNSLDMLSSKEKQILACIPLGMERLITAEEISRLVNLDIRAVRGYIERLINTHDIPIGALRNGGNNGYFIPLTETERNAGLYSLASQTDSMTKRLDTVKNADLKRAKKLKEQLTLDYAQTVEMQLTLDFESIGG